MKQYTWNVMVIVNGYHEVHTEDLSEQEADDLVKRLRDYFPDNEYYAEQVEYVEKVERYYNENAVDGWEDMYPDRDY